MATTLNGDPQFSTKVFQDGKEITLKLVQENPTINTGQTWILSLILTLNLLTLISGNLSSSTKTSKMFLMNRTDPTLDHIKIILRYTKQNNG